MSSDAGGVPYQASGYNAAAAAAPRRSKASIIIAVIAVIVAIIAILLFVFLPGGGGSVNVATATPDQVVTESFRDLLAGDVDGFFEAVPLQALDALAAESGLSVAALKDQILSQYNQATSLLSGFNIDFNSVLNLDVGSPETLTSSELESLQAFWDSRSPGFGTTFQAAANVPVTLDINEGLADTARAFLPSELSSMMDQLGQERTVECVQIDGRWYMLTLN